MLASSSTTSTLNFDPGNMAPPGVGRGKSSGNSRAKEYSDATCEQQRFLLSPERQATAPKGYCTLVPLVGIPLAPQAETATVAGSGITGNRIVNVLPLPTALHTSMSPLWASTTRRTIASPSPAPCLWRPSTCCFN